MNDLNKNLIRENSIIHKKIFLYIDVELNTDIFQISQKMVSYFGQVGIYENTEKLVETLNFYYKDLYIDHLIFKEKFDVKDELLNYFNSDIEEDSDFFDYYLDHLNKPDDIIFDENGENFLCSEELEQEEASDENQEVYDEEDNYEDCRIFLPFIMVFYRGDRKMDFYMGEGFRNNLYFNKKMVLIKEFFTNKKIFKSYNLLKSKIHKNYFFKYTTKNLNFLLKNFNVNFILKEFLKYYFFNTRKIFKYRRRKKRLMMFKKFKLKKLKKLTFFLKNFNWFNKIYAFTLLNIKVMSFSKEYRHKNYLSLVFNFFSQLNNIKCKVFRKKYRRRRRYKKKVFRNFFGKKMSLKKVLNIVEDVKKKRRR